ncbi:PepSY domain-containing protein [Streptomyces sp. DH37]|uniref:PepSY domain-containing protein n=1 Tax=Streptomyces sp. DH37 TaxID=3040122 RepID=UPI002442387A|nr:PepSY domain-containing protein [Streptomyces sp. DH37]MDG9705928.1 PepSY domain-containing protein [Streptomyces sp. DH37]
MNVKHKLVVAAVATAALAAGGSAVAFAGDDALPADALAASLRADAGDGDDTGERDERDGDRRELRGAKVTLQEAVGAALKAVPGTAESAELDDEDGRTAWDVDVLGEDGRWHEVRIDAAGGGVLGGDGADRDDRDDRSDDGGDDGDDAGGRDDDRQGARSDDSGGSEDRDDRTAGGGDDGDDRDDRTTGDRDDRTAGGEDDGDDRDDRATGDRDDRSDDGGDDRDDRTAGGGDDRSDDRGDD